MTERLVLAIETPDGNWFPFATRAPHEPPAALSNVGLNDQRETIAFGWYDGEGPCVWRSQPGRAIADEQPVGHVLSSGFDTIATSEQLALEPVVLVVTGRGRGPGGIKLRFTYQPAPSS